jgi:hypothetical protein
MDPCAPLFLLTWGPSDHSTPDDLPEILVCSLGVFVSESGSFSGKPIPWIMRILLAPGLLLRWSGTHEGNRFAAAR